MNRQGALSLTLTAALLLGQWLVSGHGAEHLLAPGGADACAVCVYSHGADAGLPPSPVGPEIVWATDGPVADPTDPIRSATSRHHPIRGPPAPLA